MAHKQPDTAENSGDRKSIKSYKEFRKCKICQKYLTKYNPDIYCFVHQAEGHRIEQKKLDKIKDEYSEKVKKKGREINAARKKNKEARTPTNRHPSKQTDRAEDCSRVAEGTYCLCI